MLTWLQGPLEAHVVKDRAEGTFETASYLCHTTPGRHLHSSTHIPHPDLSLILSMPGPWLKVWRNTKAGPVLNNGAEELLEPPSTQTL